MDRPISGKGERLEIAKRKYEMFQNRQDKLSEMDNILTGKQKETIVPKPGEFVVVSTDKKFDPSAELSLGLDDLLDSARQTIKSRLESARKSSKYKVIGSRGGMSQSRLSQMQKNQQSPSKTEANNSVMNTNNQVLYSEDNLLSSISSQPQRRFQNVSSMGTVKEKVFSQHQSNLRASQQDFQGMSQHQPVIGSQTQRGKSSQSMFSQQPGQAYGGLPHSESSNTLLNQQQQQSHNNLMMSARNLMSSQTAGHPQFGATMESISEAQETILEKQKQLVQNPDMKTSMTTSIRNIMRKQDKEMLTQSSRLLHSQLEAFEQQMLQRQQTLQTLDSQKSTLDLLQNKLISQQKQQQHTTTTQSNFHRNVTATAGFAANQQTNLPTMLPALNKSGIGLNSMYGNTSSDISQSMKTLSRPGSAYILFGGDKDVLKQGKTRMNLKGSRQRDIIAQANHSYKPQPQKFQLEKIKDPSIASHVKVPQLPSLVQHQLHMQKTLDPTSPFLEEQPVEPIIIMEENPKVIHSPTHRAMYQEIEERLKNKDKSPLRFSYNVDKIKELRHGSNSPSRGDKETARSSTLKATMKGKQTLLKATTATAGNTMKGLSEEDQRIARKKFLPIDAYDPLIDTEDPYQVILDYRDPESGLTFAKSRWFYANGESEFKECQVTRYLPTEELFEIKWLQNEQVKKVSRFNLIFLREDEDAFNRRIEEARKHREQAELIMKYYYMVENSTKTPKFEIDDEQKTRISYYIASFKPFQSNVKDHKFRLPEEFLERAAQDRYQIPSADSFKSVSYNDSVEDIHRDFLIRKYNLSTLGSLFKEMDADYTRTHKQIYFDAQLPYSAEKYNLFKTILPKEKFVPVSERIITETVRKGLIQIPERSVPFKELLVTMTQKLHQAKQEKLESLMRVNVNMIKFSPMNFFKLNYKSAQSKEFYLKTNRVQAGEVLREVRNGMFDSQYEIHSMIATEARRIKEINYQRKQAASYQSKQFKEEQIPESFINDMSQFQILLNMLYERAVRSCFEVSVASLIQCLSDVAFYMSDSLGKNILDPEPTEKLALTEEDWLRLASDPVLAKRMEKKFVLKIHIIFNKEKQVVELDPPVESWLQEIAGMIHHNVEEISFVPCFAANEIGSAREDGKVQIFAKEGDPFVEESIEKVTHYLRLMFKVPEKVEEIIKRYEYILATDIKKFKQEYKVNDYPVEKYKTELEQNEAAREHIERVLFDEKLNAGLFCMKGGKLKQQFVRKIDELNKVLFQCVKKKIDQTNGKIEQEVEHILGIINKEPIQDIEELTETMNFVNNLDKRMLAIRELINDVMGKMGLLEAYEYRLLEEEFNRTWMSFSKPLEIFQAEADCRRRMKRDEKDFFQDLRLMNEKLVKDFEEVKIEFDILQRSEELQEYEDSVVKCDTLYEKIERALAIAEISNRRENLFNLKKTDWNEIDQLRVQFVPYNTMWNLARDYFYKIGTWMNGPLSDIDRDKITQEITEACQNLVRLERIDFKEKRATGLVCQQLRKYYEEFKPFLPLIIALRNPSLKMRHWENMQRLRNPPFMEIEHELHASIQELVEKGVMEIIEEINEISDFASREKKLEDSIAKMRDEWKHVKFDLQEFRDSGTYVLKGAEPIWDLLDEHIMKTMTIASSPYIKFLQAEVNFWKNTLIKVQEILEEWTKVQRGWLYLWPIFSSEDIQRQMPQISASFQTVDKIWRNIMQGTHQNPNVLDSCLQSRVFENFQSCNEMIDRIQKGLNEYLNTKRMAFPRFFFLSNDDLLHILSQTKDPLRVQDHLNKCFEGIAKLEFQKDDSKVIKGMYSSMGEYVQFVSQIDPFNRETKEVRPVEEWLSDVEVQMRDSLRDLIKRSSAQYSSETRKRWLFEWASQIVLTLDQVFWTTQVEEMGIKRIKERPESLREVFQEEERKLQELVNLIKDPVISSNPVFVLTLGALIVLDVHSKDVTKDLALAQVDSLAAFDWISQLRYYVQDEVFTKGKESPLEINVKMVSCSRLYGFEYQGNQTRLVITPLTDRCYRTLMGALQLNLGGAPEGPAGTGKTETTKDLAKAIAKQCIVFNCSDQLDVQGMSKFFKGLACCGAWACFDEFNRIELEVLSVIAQQILTIQTALMRRRAQAPFIFDDEQIPMNPSCAVFITMNPGYAGRSELPDNLKALFRPVAMMIPNYAMIAEISLYSFGFQNARELSIKITQSLRLSSEQLSTQSHYDYGMRAVKSIILAAGGLKREYPDEDESRLALRAISDCNIPKFITEDIPLFEGIISDLFPTTDKSKPNYDILQTAIKSTLSQRNLEENEEFELKTIQLFETVQVRHGLMMVGGIMSGKTQVVHTLAQALTQVNKQAAEAQEAVEGEADNRSKNYEKVKINTINPKSISIDQLYGGFDKISHDWSDGVLATVIKDCATDKTGNRRWILLDGPVDAVWIENLNTVLDDNKKLCLSSGEIVKFTPKMTMMFEVEDLLEASPATVSRCGMVYMNPDKLGWQVQIKPWIRSLPSQLSIEGRAQTYEELIEWAVPKVMGYLFGYEQTLEEERRLEGLKTVIQVTKNWSFRSFLTLFESLLMREETRESLEKKEQEMRDKEEAKRKYEQMQGLDKQDTLKKKRHDEKKVSPQQRSEILSLFLMALSWGFGAPLHSGGRQLFSQFLQDELLASIFTQAVDDDSAPKALTFAGDIQRKQVLDETGDFYSYFYHHQSEQWVRWDFEIEKFDIQGNLIADKKKQQELDDEAADNNIDYNTNGMPVEQTIEFQSIMVPTEDTMRYSYLLHTLTQHSYQVLFIGETGTGKTAAVKKFQNSTLPKDEWEVGQMVLSATSTAFQVQDYIQGRLEKQKKGVYGPKVPGRRLLIFVDDLNMPAKEKYGAQPPIEMLRQTIDNGGYYDMKGGQNEFVRIVQTYFCAAMGIPGGGKTLPSKRLMRHFNLIHIPPYSSDNLFRIFSKILEWGYESHPEQWAKQIKTITKLTISLYERCLQVLLPLPSKSHYLFNLRQVSEIIQGLLMVSKETANKLDASQRLGFLQRLWLHESVRVFADRLINDEDKVLFTHTLQKTVNELAPKYIDFTQVNVDSLIFCNFVKYNPADPTYDESQSHDQMVSTIQQVLEHFNQVNHKDKLSLLIFDYVVQHLSRLSRIIYKPYGNGLLIGLGGQGRRSLSRLASFINECTIFKVEVTKSYGRNEWADDLKSLYKSLGVDNKKTVFTFFDTDIKQEFFIEDVNNILNVGEVPNLYTADELEEIKYEMQKTVKKRDGEPFDVFQKRTRQNLHMLLFMSPAGSTLRQYIRQYPSLVNCTSIDWFLDWPQQALQTVSQNFLSSSSLFELKRPNLVKRPKEKPISLNDSHDEQKHDQSNIDLQGTQQQDNQQLMQEYETVEEPLSNEDREYNDQITDLRDKVASIFVKMHSAVSNLASDYKREKNRQVYVTPTRFIELFALFNNLMSRKHSFIDADRNKYLVGIQKLEEANLIVDRMKEQLEDLKPMLEQKSKQVEATMVFLDKETKEVDAVKAIVDAEAQIVFQQKEVAQGIKNECQSRLAEAQPLLDEALRALKTINTKDFVTMKSYNSPPYPIKLALEASCIMLGIAPKLIDGPVDKNTKKAKKIPDYWEKSKKLLNDYKKYISMLENYDKDNIPEDRIHKIQEYLQNPKFIPDEIRKASEAAEGITKWVIAICKYDVIAKEIRPKREALGEAQAKLDVVLKQLQEKEAQLQKIIDKKNALEEEFKAQNLERQSLIMQRDECQAKLSRASILMNSLGNEKERWIKTSHRLLREKKSLLGDMILATGSITYLGPFEGSFRERLVGKEWRIIISQQEILVGEAFTLKDSIGNPSLIQQWQLKGLPSDSVSIENMIIVEETKDKWPLYIDPQGQAFKFLKEHLSTDGGKDGKDQEVVVIKAQQENYGRKLEQAMAQGLCVLMENVGESFDSMMTAVINRELVEISGEKYIKFNDNQVEYDEAFRFVMVSNLANPHFTPEMQTKTRLLNFSVTREGLQQQLLSVVCRNESQRDEDERDRIQRQNIEFKDQKKNIEAQILLQLSQSGDDILDDDSLVNSLNESKKITDDIKTKLKTAKIVEERIDENRKNYKPVANHGAKLYFSIQELPALDPMYQFSMRWFRELFVQSFSYSAEKVKDTRGRVRQLKQDFLKVLYANVCRSLFEHHKLMFAFSMAIKLHEENDDEHLGGGVGGPEEGKGLKAKELELLQALQGNVGGGSSHGGTNSIVMNAPSNVHKRNNRSIIDKKSDTGSQVGMSMIAQQMQQKNEEERLRIPKDELKYLLTGLVAADAEVEERNNPVESFLENKTWQQIMELATMEHFESLPDDIEKNPIAWRKFVQVSSEQPPEPYNSLLPDFSMILLHKILKPEKTILMIEKYIEKALGTFFLKPPQYALEEIYADSKPHVPIMLILTPGNDPMEQIKKFGEEKNRMPYPVSLGRGQGEKAKAIISEIKQFGGWVVLQNCHLAASFLPELEQIIESIQPSVFQSSGKSKIEDDSKDSKKELKPPNPEFRLWLTSMSDSCFPLSILQNSIKLTSEPPKGLKPSLLRSYAQIEQSKAEKEFFNTNSKPEQWRKLYLALAFFHGIVRERRRYGSLGWNLRYDFNDSDFRISMRQLHLMVDSFEKIPFKALSYLTGECNYGGRVTDDWDRRTLTTILKDFYTRKCLKDKHTFCGESQPDYFILQEGEFDDYFQFVRDLPDTESPMLVGLNENANITYAINEAGSIINDVLNLTKNSGGDQQNSSETQQAMKMAKEILYSIREPFKVKEVEKKFPFRYDESMNSVLLQELARFNTLIEVVKSSLETLIKTLEGKLVMNAEIERMLKSIINNNIPDNWRARSYPSKKPLLSYVKDLQRRLQMLDDWISHGQPPCFWISGFFFTQSFLTGVKQNFARKYRYPIDKVVFTFHVLKYEDDTTKAPENGCIVKGLFLEGAGWDNDKSILKESEPKVLFVELPAMHFLPELEKEVSLDNPQMQTQSKKKKRRNSDSSQDENEDPEQSDEEGEKKEVKIELKSYTCPVYKTSQRAGTLSTTGHSTNYILSTQLPTYQTEDIWVKRSVAMLSQLDD